MKRTLNIFLIVLLTLLASVPASSQVFGGGGTGGSESTVVSNSGAGAQVLKTSTNVTGRTLVGGTNVTVTQNTDDVTIGLTTAVAGGNCTAGQYTTGVTAVTGVPVCSAVAFSQLSGTASKAQQHASTFYTDQSNTISTGTQDFSAATAFLPKVSAGYAPTTNAHFGYDSTTHRFVGGVNGTLIRFALQGSGTPATDDCAKFNASGHLVSAGAACGSGGGTSITRTAVSFSATPTFTRTTAIQQWTMTLTGNVTSSTLASASAGDLLSFEFTQDSTPRTVVLPTGFPTVSLCSTAGVITAIKFVWTGSAAVQYSYSAPGCTDRVISWSDATTTTFPAGSDTAVTLAATQTLTNKTLTTPTIASFTNATHTHADAAGGGTLNASSVAAGTIATARLGSGTANNTTFLRGDQTWATPSGGGSLDLSVDGYCFPANMCAPFDAPGGGVITNLANRVFTMKVVIPYKIKVGTMKVYPATAGTGEYLAIGFYTHDSVNNKADTLIAGTTGVFNNWGTGALLSAAVASASTLDPGVYWFAWATTLATAQFYKRNSSGVQVIDHALQPTGSLAYCGNAATGTYTLPATCGTKNTASTGIFEPWLFVTP